jgi:hypothetical protein
MKAKNSFAFSFFFFFFSFFSPSPSIMNWDEFCNMLPEKELLALSATCTKKMLLLDSELLVKEIYQKLIGDRFYVLPHSVRQAHKENLEKMLPARGIHTQRVDIPVKIRSPMYQLQSDEDKDKTSEMENYDYENMLEWIKEAKLPVVECGNEFFSRKGEWSSGGDYDSPSEAVGYTSPLLLYYGGYFPKKKGEMRMKIDPKRVILIGMGYNEGIVLNMEEANEKWEELVKRENENEEKEGPPQKKAKLEEVEKDYDYYHKKYSVSFIPLWK